MMPARCDGESIKHFPRDFARNFARRKGFRAESLGVVGYGSVGVGWKYEKLKYGSGGWKIEKARIAITGNLKPWSRLPPHPSVSLS
jgi:hypothetical protein